MRMSASCASSCQVGSPCRCCRRDNGKSLVRVAVADVFTHSARTLMSNGSPAPQATPSDDFDVPEAVEAISQDLLEALRDDVRG